MVKSRVDANQHEGHKVNAMREGRRHRPRRRRLTATRRDVLFFLICPLRPSSIVRLCLLFKMKNVQDKRKIKDYEFWNWELASELGISVDVVVVVGLGSICLEIQMHCYCFPFAFALLCFSFRFLTSFLQVSDFENWQFSRNESQKTRQDIRLMHMPKANTHKKDIRVERTSLS